MLDAIDAHAGRFHLPGADVKGGAELAAAAALSQRDWLENSVSRAAGGKLPPYVLRTESPQRHVFRDRVNLGWLQSAAAGQPAHRQHDRRRQ